MSIINLLYKELSDLMAIPQRLFSPFIIVFSYIFFGWLGGFFTINPGFASAIWPAAGVSLAIYFKYGRSALLWIFVGSILANLFNSGANLLDLSLSDWMWNSLRTAGSVTQLIVAKALITRLCPTPIHFGSFKEINTTLLIAGPLSCSIAATIGALSLYGQGYVQLSNLEFTWFTWWVGDSIGVMFFFPVALALIGSKYVKSITNRTQILLAAVLMLTIVSLTFNYSKQVFKDNLSMEFKQATSNQIAKIDIIKNGIKDKLKALAAIMLTKPDDISRLEFSEFAKQIKNPNDAYRAMGWLPKVIPDATEQWQIQARASGIKNAKLKRWTPLGLTSIRDQAYYLPITYIEPLENNLSAIGLDIYSHPIAKVAAFKAIDNHTAAATPPMQLVQQGEKYTGNVIYYPVMRIIEDQYKTLGLVEVVLEADVITQPLFGHQHLTEQYQIKIFDTEQPMQPFVDSLSSHKGALFKEAYPVDWFGRQWEIVFTSSKTFENTHKDWLSWLTLIVGLFVATLGMSFVLVLTSFNGQLKKQVELQTEQLTKLITKLESASQAKSTFLANMSHELRTPLNAIIGFVDIAQERVKDHASLDYFNRIKHSSELLLNGINHVLDFSKIESGKFYIEQRAFSLQASVDRIQTSFEQLAQRKGLYLRVNQAVDPLPSITSDQARIEQIITNLLGNAVKFTEKGGIIVNIDLTRKNFLIVSVTDTGIGISAEAQTRLFEQFEQADQSTTRKFGGTGLGLTISKQICTLMGGDITVDSNEGEGSRFRVRIPVKIAPSQHKNTIKTKPQDLNHLSTAKVLLVEDNDINQIVATEMLNLLNCQVTTANNGQEALHYLSEQASSNLPHVILMDIQMPVMDGYEATNVIQKDNELRHIPIIGLSANATTDDLNKASKMGMKGYITKPINKERLIEAINKYRP